MRILVTGATGFLGGAVAAHLLTAGYEVRASTRSNTPTLSHPLEVVCVPTLSADTDWRSALAGIDAVVHCAARVHIMKEETADALGEFRRTNVDGTLQLAHQAVQAGLRRFIFISSIGVHGAETFETPFSADSPILPNSPYAQSKWEAEEALLGLAAQTDLEVVIIRPPMIYGPGAPGNFASLLRAVNLYIPLPLGRINNKRSFVALDNVTNLIAHCLRHPNAAGQAFLVSDGNDLTSTEFIRKIALAQGKRSMLIPIPYRWLQMLARCAGKESQLRKITGSLQIDIRKTRTLLDWEPVIDVDSALISATQPRDFGGCL